MAKKRTEKLGDTVGTLPDGAVRPLVDAWLVQEASSKIPTANCRRIEWVIDGADLQGRRFELPKGPIDQGQRITHPRFPSRVEQLGPSQGLGRRRHGVTGPPTPVSPTLRTTLPRVADTRYG